MKCVAYHVISISELYMCTSAKWPILTQGEILGGASLANRLNELLPYTEEGSC